MCTVSQWMQKGDLTRYLNDFPEHSHMPLLVDVIASLDYLHSFGIAHAGLEAGNVLVTDTRQAVIGDFGIASLGFSTTTQVSNGTSHWTAPGSTANTTTYNDESMDDSSRELNKKGGGRFSGVGAKLRAVTTRAGRNASAVDVHATEQAMSKAVANGSSSEYKSSSSDNESPPNIRGHSESRHHHSRATSVASHSHWSRSVSPVHPSLQNSSLVPHTKSPPPINKPFNKGVLLLLMCNLPSLKHSTDFEVQPNPTQMWHHFESVTDTDNKPLPALQSIIDKNAFLDLNTPSMHLGPHVSGPNPHAQLSNWAEDTDLFPTLDPAGVTPEPPVPKLNPAILEIVDASVNTSHYNIPPPLSDKETGAASYSVTVPEQPRPRIGDENMQDVGTSGTIDTAQGSNVVDPLRPNSPPVEEYKETIGEASMTLQECADWIHLFPVNKGKFTPSGAIADELAYLLTAIYDGGWEHTVIEDSSIIEGYVPKNVTNFTLKQLMDRLFFPTRPPYIEKKDKGKAKAKEVVPSSQPLEDQDIEMITTEGVQKTQTAKLAPNKPTPKRTPPKPPIKAAFPPLPKPPTPKVSSSLLKNPFPISSAQPVKSYAAASRSNAPTPSTIATKQVVDLVELVKLYGDKLPADRIAAMHQAAVGNANSGNTNNTSIPQKKKFVVKSTTWGPTHKQVLIPYSEMVTITCLQRHHHILETVNRGLINQHSKLHILAMSEGRSGAAFGLAFSTNLVPTPSECDIIHEWLSKAIQCNKDKVPVPRVPMSKSYLKITGVNFYMPTDWHEDGSNQLTADDVLYVMNCNPLFESITLASPPRVMRATPHSDMLISALMKGSVTPLDCASEGVVCPIDVQMQELMKWSWEYNSKKRPTPEDLQRIFHGLDIQDDRPPSAHGGPVLRESREAKSAVEIDYQRIPGILQRARKPKTQESYSTRNEAEVPETPQMTDLGQFHYGFEVTNNLHSADVSDGSTGSTIFGGGQRVAAAGYSTRQSRREVETTGSIAREAGE
ncbi:Serine/threonine-protein kinase HT1 [Leucoagaricus sp. SymC.cos]|nr:Serine/threonine-protein kinase HT1 [Leucoagaricus sp. SymC.cos]